MGAGKEACRATVAGRVVWGFQCCFPSVGNSLQSNQSVMFPCLSNSTVAPYSFWFCLQPWFNPADLLLLLCHCWHGVLCWCGLPELLQVSTANPSPLLQWSWCTASSSELWQHCPPVEKGPEDGSEWGFAGKATCCDIWETLCFSRKGGMKWLLHCAWKGRDSCGSVGWFIMSSVTCLG